MLKLPYDEVFFELSKQERKPLNVVKDYQIKVRLFRLTSKQTFFMKI